MSTSNHRKCQHRIIGTRVFALRTTSKLQKTLITVLSSTYDKLFNDTILCRIVLQKRHSSEVDEEEEDEEEEDVSAFGDGFLKLSVLQTKTGQLALQTTKSLVLLVTACCKLASCLRFPIIT